MTNKCLHKTLIGLLAVLAVVAARGASAQGEAPATVSPPPPVATQCDAEGCSDGGQLLMRVRTRGERAPASSADDQGKELTQALRRDRRVTVEMERQTEAAAPGRAVATGKWSVQLPDGGAIWITEDPALGQPQLNVSAPSLVPFDGRRITQPVSFYVRTNYPRFIERAEVLVFRAFDTDLVTPLARLPLPVAAVAQVDWDGALPSGFQARPGDELAYIVRAHGADGSVDETHAARLQLVRPHEAERGRLMLRETLERRQGQAFSVEEAERRRLIDEAFAGDGLRLQNIGLQGSRIRILGRNLPQGAQVKINGESYPVDQERKLGAEFLEPVGRHAYALEITGPDREQPLRHTLELEVTGRYRFAVALADLTLSGNKASGSVATLGEDAARLDDSLVTDGRLAFYGKGKFGGKYLITAQADTRERELGELFSNFWDPRPVDIFRRLDPDQHYPVFGDDSTTLRDVDTMGPLYLRADWDKSQALWGNYNTGITGTEYGQYSRSLYGGALNWRSRASNAWGEAGSALKLFAAKAQTAPGHSEFIGTGGSLYYLRHNDILPGSERAVIELRDTTTGRVEQRIELMPGADYEIDHFQGRILLANTLAGITRNGLRRIGRDTPLDGYQQMLLVDYEYIPSGFDTDELTAGLRTKHWFGDHLGVGLTYVDENRAGDDYSLASADITLQAGRGTYLKLEHARTEATSAPVFFSDNGGLNFTQLNGLSGRREGNASAIEARANLRELGWTEQDWQLSAWRRRADAGYSTARLDTGVPVNEYGVEALGQLSPDLAVYLRHSHAERGAEALIQSQLTGEWRIGEDGTLSAEARRVQERRASGEGTGTLGALKYLHRFGGSLELYGVGQLTLEQEGAYADNDAFTLGGKYQFGELSSVGAEVTQGDRGKAAQLNAEHRLGRDHTLYGSYTWSPDQAVRDPLFNTGGQDGWTLGQRWRLSEQTRLFNESQFLKAPQESGLAHTFGMDFYPGRNWNLGFTLQEADLDALEGAVQRRAASLSGGRTDYLSQWQSKLEWREDTGAQQREQWVSTNRLTHRLNESLRVAARLNWSDTNDRLNPAAGAKFLEGNLGFAWRPWDNTRWALLGRYTYQYDVSSLPQQENVAFYDQRSHVLSLEGIYHPRRDWEFAAKLARREGEVRMGRMQGQWADSSATFAALQARYGLVADWHALGELRWLGVKDGGTRKGLLLGVDRDIGHHFRIGVGYNFTDFSDDLTDFDYRHRGWFLSIVGTY